MNQLAPIGRANNGVMVILPQSIDETWRVARMAVVGKMAPKSLVDGKDPDEATSACAIAIMAGAELGLTPLMALRSYAVVNGRPSLWGDGLKAVVRQSGRCEYIRTGSDQTKGWCEAKRSDTGEEKRVEFTMEQAKRAGLATKSGPWKDGYADVMMERRATNRCLNDLFADILGGIVDQQEAIDDGSFEDRAPAAAKLTPPSPPSPPSPPKIIEPTFDEAIEVTPFDPATFLAELIEALNLTTSEPLLEETWDSFDVEASLTDHEDLLQQAFDLKKDLLAKFDFPGDRA